MARKPPTTPAPNLLDGYDKNDPTSLEAVEAKVRSYVKLGFLKMNRAQGPFIRVKNRRGKTPRTRLFESGNQVGKCTTISTLIQTIHGEVTVGELFRIGQPFEVYAWDGERKVAAQASAPFKKPGLHQCYRITLSDGRWIEAADRHRLLVDGQYVFLEDLYESLLLQPVSSSEPCLSVRASGELHWFQTPSGFLEHCAAYLRRCGEPPLMKAAVVQGASPSPAYARGRILLESCSDGRETRYKRTLCGSSFLRSSLDGLLRLAARCVVWIDQGAYTASLWSPGELQFFRQPNAVVGAQPQSCAERPRYLAPLNSASSSFQPPIELGNYVDSITIVPSLQEVYDFEVAVHHNYFAAGLIHHNTSIGVAEDIAHAMGFRPWLEKDDPDYKINVRVPNNGIVGCEVAGQTLAQRIEPEFMSLIPEYCGVTASRYSDGSIKSIHLARDFNGKDCGSTIHFRSYVQPASSYEGTVLDWIHFDEPPPQDILTAATRGLMSTNGPSWYTMTPLKEAYIYDLLSLHAFNNGGDDPEIAVFRGSTWDNCQDWCRDCDVTIAQNDPERLEAGQVRPIDLCPRCRRVMGFLPRAGIENYLKKITDPDEREAREEGKWKHLSGLVYKELDREKHIYDDFTIPNDWMRIEVLDPHDARPCCWLFGAVSPEEIVVNGKSANRIYWYSYLKPSGNIESIARQVKVKRAEHNYKEPAMLIIDVKFAAALKPLHGEVQPSWEEELEKAGMKHIVHSCSAPGDVSLGHKRVKEYLMDHYSTVRGISFPGMMFARQGTSGDGGPMQHLSNYSWEEGKDKPKEAYKDFSDCVRYAALEQPEHKAPQPEIDQEFARMIMNRENRPSTESTLFYGLSMRS